MNLDEIEKRDAIRIFLEETKISGWFKKGLGKSLKNYRDETKRRAKEKYGRCGT
jgi:hypothetical protein